MAIVEILSKLKDKVLDNVNIELLRSAYELQDKNIDQLTRNNDALKESNELLKEKIAGLAKENEALKKRISDLENELEQKKGVDSSQRLSEVAMAILEQCIKNDVTNFNDEMMISRLSPRSRLQVETGIDELGSLDLINLGSVSGMGRGANYYLTVKGKKLASKLSPREES